MSDNPEKRQKHVDSASKGSYGEVNMEASVTADEIIRAGGLGATDSISSFVPVASDSTDVEARLRDYEDLQPNAPEDITEVPKVEDDRKATGDVNMEASITSDEMTRAGGFGATDDISNFLPVASDFTDFEAHIRDARDYEDSDEQINRPGLGWSNETK